MDLVLTQAAETFIRRMLRFSSGTDGFRMVATSGGCSGLSATFDVEAAPHAGDIVVERGDYRLFLPEGNAELLNGVTIDFRDSVASTGFVFLDPNSASCRCSGDSTAAARAPLHQLGEF